MNHTDWDSIPIDDQAMAAIGYIRDLVPGVPDPTDTSIGLAYPMAADTAWFLCDELVRANTDYFPRLFERVEDMVSRGTQRVRNLVIIGFLEDLQNATLQADLPLDAWNRWLGSNTLAMWLAVNAYWSGDDEALARVRDETGLAFGDG